MSLASSIAPLSGGAKIRLSPEPSTTRLQARQSWWRSLWFRRDGRFEEIRQLMLDQLTAVDDEGMRSALEDRISAAEHPEALWSLRQQLMQAMVHVHGEMLARRRLTDITFMFAGLLDRQRHAATIAGSPDDTTGWPAGNATHSMVRTVTQLRTDH